MAKSAITEESGAQKQKGKVLYPLFFSVGLFSNPDVAHLLLFFCVERILINQSIGRCVLAKAYKTLCRGGKEAIDEAALKQQEVGDSFPMIWWQLFDMLYTCTVSSFAIIHDT